MGKNNNGSQLVPKIKLMWLNIKKVASELTKYFLTLGTIEFVSWFCVQNYIFKYV